MDKKVNIPDLRKKMGWSQERFAREVGVSSKTTWRWENGLSKPSPLANEKLLKLCRPSGSEAVLRRNDPS